MKLLITLFIPVLFQIFTYQYLIKKSQFRTKRQDFQVRTHLLDTFFLSLISLEITMVKLHIHLQEKYPINYVTR